jgi:elongation factor 1-beta
MANVIITLKIMPTSPEVDLAAVEDSTKKLIVEFAGEGEMKIEQEPVAFGLKAVKFTFVSDEERGSTEELETKISELENVNSVEVTDVRRAIG